jgi:hypothetical protein
MRSNLHLSILGCLLSFGTVALLACEDNPDECFSNNDCDAGMTCVATYYNSKARSGGYCESVGIDASKEGDTQTAADGTTAATDAGTDTSVVAPMDAATEDGQTTQPTTDATADAVSPNPEGGTSEGGQTTQPTTDASADTGSVVPEGGQ